MEASDQEMADAAPLEPAVEEATGGSGEEAVRAADIEMDPAAAEGVDQAFLDALPPELRAEMLASRDQPASASQPEPEPAAAPAAGGEHHSALS